MVANGVEILQSINIKSFLHKKKSYRFVRKLKSTYFWLKPGRRLVLSYSFLPTTTMFPLTIFPQKGSWWAFSQTYTDRKHPCCFQSACEWGLQNRGWQQSTVDAYQEGSQPPLMLLIRRTIAVRAWWELSFSASLKLTSLLPLMRSG